MSGELSDTALEARPKSMRNSLWSRLLSAPPVCLIQSVPLKSFSTIIQDRRFGSQTSDESDDPVLFLHKLHLNKVYHRAQALENLIKKGTSIIKLSVVSSYSSLIKQHELYHTHKWTNPQHVIKLTLPQVSHPIHPLGCSAVPPLINQATCYSPQVQVLVNLPTNFYLEYECFSPKATTQPSLYFIFLINLVSWCLSQLARTSTNSKDTQPPPTSNKQQVTLSTNAKTAGKKLRDILSLLTGIWT